MNNKNYNILLIVILCIIAVCNVVKALYFFDLSYTVHKSYDIVSSHPIDDHTEIENETTEELTESTEEITESTDLSESFISLLYDSLSVSYLIIPRLFFFFIAFYYFRICIRLIIGIFHHEKI